MIFIQIQLKQNVLKLLVLEKGANRLKLGQLADFQAGNLASNSSRCSKMQNCEDASFAFSKSNKTFPSSLANLLLW